MKKKLQQIIEENQPQDIFRVEIRNHFGGYDLAGIKYTMEDAMRLVEFYDKYFVKVLDCRNKRKEVYKNF